MNIEEIKAHFEEFAEKEAKAFDAMRVKDLENQNKTYDDMHRVVDSTLHGHLGVTRLKHLLSPLVYRNYNNDDSKNTPRLVVKISEYDLQSYGTVWVIYASPMNTEKEHCAFGDAFLCIEENSEFLIAAHFIHHLDQDIPGNHYYWLKSFGREDLDLSSLQYPKRVERYIEPITGRSRQLYLEDR
jgi:hypothetical protein